MKLTALMVCINEEDYIYYALKSIYDVVEEIIIVEGAANHRFAPDAEERGVLSPRGLSGDNTYLEIQRMLDEDVDHKITVIRHGRADTVNTLRRIGLRSMHPDADYCLVVDADTLFKPEEIISLRSLVTTYPNIWMIASRELMFFLDFGHILTVGKKYLKLCNYLDTGLFWKYSTELEFRAQRPYWKNEKFEAKLQPLWDLRRYSRETPQCLFSITGVFQEFHYGWVHTPEKMEGHILRIAHAHINRAAAGDTTGHFPQFLPLVGKSDKEILSWYHTYHKIWTGLFDETVEEHLEEFKGAHPRIMKTHPYHGKSKKELGWNEGW